MCTGSRERLALPGELAPTQISLFQNWAISIYNELGGYTIGQVWKNPDDPNPMAASFPEGTVAFKLLFTQATQDEVPYLKGSKEWDAFIYTDTVVPTNPLGARNIQRVRLLQIDVAIKDDRSPTGWVFGTFVMMGMSWRFCWDRIFPVGLMWGNDPDVTVAMIRNGARLKESVINSVSDLPFQHLGWGGRLNGPVDHPNSSCLFVPLNISVAA